MIESAELPRRCAAALSCFSDCFAQVLNCPPNLLQLVRQLTFRVALNLPLAPPSLEILSIQRVREFSILIPDCIAKNLRCLSLSRFPDSPSRPPSLRGCQAREGGETETNREGRKEDSRQSERWTSIHQTLV